MDYKIDYFEKHSDKRGQLVVFLKNTDLDKKNKIFGQIYFVTFKKKGAVRGNHYHKKWREWFGVVSGKVEVILKDIESGQIVKLFLDGDREKYVRLEIGPNIAHAFKNISKHASLLNYANIQWSKKDTFHVELI